MRKRVFKSGRALALWSDVAGMMMDSAQVIAYRSRLMAKPGHSLADRRELGRMVSEKVAAAHEASLVVARAAAGFGLATPATMARLVKPFAKRARANARRLSGLKP